MTEPTLIEKWKRSRFWRDGMEFRASDVASFCEIPVDRARQVLSAMKEEIAPTTPTYYRRRTVQIPLLRMRWNNPVSDEYTPRYY